MQKSPTKTGSVEREIVRLLRSYILSWLCLVSTLASVIFMSLATPGGLLEDQPFELRFAIHLLNAAVYLGFSYITLPRAFIWAYAKGWPFLWVQTAGYIAPSIFATLVFTSLDDVRLLSPEFWWYALIVFMVSAISVFVGLLAFWVYATPSAGIDMNPNRIWHRQRSATCRLQPHIRPDARGRVLRMSAENQYVRIETAAGEDLIRMGLTEAIDLLPESTGLRIHRSHWIANDQAAELKFEGGNPRLRLTDGTKLPVSRRSVSELRKILP